MSKKKDNFIEFFSPGIIFSPEIESQGGNIQKC